MKTVVAVVSILSLAACLLAAVLYFVGTVDAPTFKAMLLFASIVYFIAATMWAGREASAVKHSA